MDEREGRCNCGAVRVKVRGEPIRVGLCHCLTCQRETGGPAMAFATWAAGNVALDGEVRDWGENAYRRWFCGTCGSRVGGRTGTKDEIEVRLGAFDEGGRGLTPTLEIWTIRRQPWLAPLPGADQFDRDGE